MSRESKQKILGLTSEDFLFVVFNPLAVAVALTVPQPPESAMQFLL